MIRHKFGAKKTEINDIVFASKKEAKRYRELLLLQSVGEILFFLRQVPFHLPGKTKYLCDFLVFWADGNVTIEDVKGFKTAMYILKKKQVEDVYPVTITEI
jgi:hypothetical protein